MLSQVGNRLCYRFDAEKLWIEPWGTNSPRVRATKDSVMPEYDNWALLTVPDQSAHILIERERATITNGSLTATINESGKLSMKKIDGTIVLEEFVRNRINPVDPNCSALMVDAREFKPIPGGDYHLTLRLGGLDEKLFGMGQYQQEVFDLKGTDLELAHRNSQASVPFFLSSRGYGFLWHNPAIGRAVFAKNKTTFEAYSTKILDYWVTSGPTPDVILRQYGQATGTVPMMPEYGLGFWQTKLRYQTQEELLEVAREHKIRRGLPLDVIVCDFFHWPRQGDWKFDTTYWADPTAMVQQLRELGVELMVSIWPSVDKRSENYQEMVEKGYLVRCDRGVRTTFDFEGESVYFDATNPEARDFVWAVAKRNYFDHGVNLFWLDEAEPEYTAYDFDNYRYHLGSNLQIGNLYSVGYAQAFFDGMKKCRSGDDKIVNLIRCAWAGSQRLGALVWSGDIASSWSSLRNQLYAGLHMGIAGIPWWTTDIGGFHGGDPNDEVFRELFVRWFQWGTFCPVMRLHGDREPRQPPQGTTGGATCQSGAANEIWSYGEDVYQICKKHIEIRESLRDYIHQLMKDAHEVGAPIMRPCFYDFPGDARCWDIGDQYMFGPDMLCAPVLFPDQRKRRLYLPSGCSWRIRDGDNIWPGGQDLELDAPLESMPVLMRVP